MLNDSNFEAVNLWERNITGSLHGHSFSSCDKRHQLKHNRKYCRYFVIIAPWKRTGLFIWTNLNPLHPRMHCAKLVEIGQVVPEKNIFFNFDNVVSLFSNYLPLKMAGPFIWTNLNSLHPSMHDAKFGWNWPCCSGEEDFLISQM